MEAFTCPTELRGSASAVYERTESAENKIQNGRRDAEAQFGCLMVVQQVIPSKVSQHSHTAFSVVTLKMNPLVIKVTGGHAEEKERRYRP